ncbi:hypothetical protein [uncultured Amnibacterium sp.]|uniref:hypothetical protein n=1 Tax=uncultured Amnibacterium sp. TaxID=1631851 RepID=UPI0035CBFA41
MTPAGRLLFWIKAAFVGDAALAAFGAILLATGAERPAVWVFVFVGVRVALGVAALVIAIHALDRGDPNDDRPSSVR